MKDTSLIPELGKGLQRYQPNDAEALDPLNTIEIFNSEIWPRIKQYFLNSNHVLDVGCGNGRYSAFLSDHVKDVTAMDAFREMNNVHKRSNIRFMKTTFQESDNEKYDVIFLFGVFYLQESWGTHLAFEKMVSKLNEGGYIVTIDDKKRDRRHAPSESLPAGYYNLQELCDDYGGKIINSFVQHNNVHKVTVIKK